MTSSQVEQRLDRRVFVVGVINGSLYNASTQLVDMTVVLSVLAAQLVRSDTLVGLLLVSFNIGWLWPSLFMPYVLEGWARKIGWYRAAAIVRFLSLAAVTCLLFSPLPRTSPNTAFLLLCLFLFTQTSFGGLSWIPFMDIVAKGVPPNRRGLFWSLRQGIAAAMGIGAACLVKYLLDPARGFQFPVGYAWLFGLTSAAQMLGMGAFCLASEPAGERRPRRMTFRMHAWRGPRLLRRDAAYRTFAIIRASISLAQMGIPFLAVYGHKRFGFTDSETGGWLLPVAIAGVAYPFLWGGLNDRFGARIIMRIGTALSIAQAALVLGLAARSWLGLASPHEAKLVLCAGLVMGYASTSCTGMAIPNYVLDLAPRHQRDTYIGFTNTLGIPLAFSGLLAGVIGDHLSLEALYAVCMGLSVVSALLAFVCLPELRATGYGPRRPPSAGEPEGAPEERPESGGAESVLIAPTGPGVASPRLWE